MDQYIYAIFPMRVLNSGFHFITLIEQVCIAIEYMIITRVTGLSDNGHEDIIIILRIMYIEFGV